MVYSAMAMGLVAMGVWGWMVRTIQQDQRAEDADLARLAELQGQINRVRRSMR